jgi:RND family efflux transporter MFP subunit
MAFKKTVKFGGILLLLGLAMFFWFTFKGEKKNDVHTTDVTAKEEVQEDVSATTKPKRKIKYWRSPMDPTYIRDKPGKSPMGMDLIPVYDDEEEESDLGVIKINPVIVQNMGVRTTKASRGSLHVTIRTVGHITYDEKLVEQIHTKISGWVEKLFVDTTGEELQKGQELLSIYSPELVTTQEEYLQALKYREKVSISRFTEVARGGETLIKATRKRLLLMDIDPEQIKALEKRAEVQNNMILRSPTDGIVIKKHVLDGMKVNPGMQLYTIADISRVWVMGSVYEYELPFLKVGQEVEITLPYEPGAKYKGHISFIYPYLSSKTRTVQVRMEFENPNLKLKPDMYADVVIKTKASDNAVLVPSEAVIRTGSRNVVITALDGGKFLPKEVTLGPEGEGFVQIVSGLNEGETVVTSGQFLIDSESNLREAINKMLKARKAVSAAKEETLPHPPEHRTGEMKMEPR